MRIAAALCAVIGHRGRVDETSTDSEAHIRCQRCDREQDAPDGTVLGRIDAKTFGDRSVGPVPSRGP